MATEAGVAAGRRAGGDRRPLWAGLALLLGLAGCDPTAERCRAGTLAVALTLASGAADADQLDVAIALDGGSALTTTLEHTAGQASGNVVVAFPRGYPGGSVVSVTVTARAGGVIVGNGSAQATLSGDCQAVTLGVAAVVASGDAAADLAPTDSAVPVDDAAADLASPGASDDLSAPRDLGPPPPDLVCPGGGVELCFNGIDDDCDGHVDCDNPDCAPVAVCVPPVAVSFAYGTQEPPGGACPTQTSGGPVYLQDGQGGGCAGSCSCNPSGCSATIGTSPSCPSGTPANFATLSSSSCTNVEDQINLVFGKVGGTLSCGQSGSAAPVTPPALTSTLACTMSGTATSGGCSNGQVCAARGTKQCVITSGAGASCPAAYPTGASWYSSFTDHRTCTCSCGAAAGGCTDPSVGVTFYDSKSCSGTPHPESGSFCDNSYLGAKIAGGCTLSVNFANPIVFSGASTVCCQ